MSNRIFASTNPFLTRPKVRHFRHFSKEWLQTRFRCHRHHQGVIGSAAQAHPTLAPKVSHADIEEYIFQKLKQFELFKL